MKFLFSKTHLLITSKRGVARTNQIQNVNIKKNLVITNHLEKNFFYIHHFWVGIWLRRELFKHKNKFFIFLRGLQRHGKLSFIFNFFKKTCLTIKKYKKMSTKIFLRKRRPNKILFFRQRFSIYEKYDFLLSNLNFTATKYYRMEKKRKHSRKKHKFIYKILRNNKQISEFSFWHRRLMDIQDGRKIVYRLFLLLLHTFMSKKRLWFTLISNVTTNAASLEKKIWRRPTRLYILRRKRSRWYRKLNFKINLRVVKKKTRRRKIIRIKYEKKLLKKTKVFISFKNWYRRNRRLKFYFRLRFKPVFNKFIGGARLLLKRYPLSRPLL
jgi:hypothetical protein